jgi:eukaryotic-like serine/threonine-protein kinase
MHAMNNDDLDSLVGRSLGQYRIVERIGAGGMATVFKGYQPNLDRYVAVKVLPAYHARDPVFRERFAREARSVAKLAHPNIVQIHDSGEQDSITYIVMEYVDGGTLKDRLKRYPSGLAIPETVDFMIQAAEGLGCAHRNGIVHRDVKPANMLLRTEGNLLISDFGIVKILDATNLTRVGTGIGTPQYMSPEQCTGQAVDRRSDIYSLGIVMFHCLTGRVPFNAESPVSITVKHINEPLPVQHLQMIGVPPPIEQIVVKMTAKAPQDRYQTMEAVVTALKGVLIDWPRNPWPASGPLPAVASGPLAGSGQGAFPVAREQEYQQPAVTVTCFRCGSANPSSRLFCTTCGYDLSDTSSVNDRYLGPNGRPVLARLTLQNGENAGRSYLFHQVMTTIGRTNGNNLIISGRTVSRRHARLWFDNSRWFLEDLQSANGTSVNNVRISNQPVVLKDGDIINFGDEIVLFNIAYK